ncbi:MAG TPA: hypothetical protein ENO05_11945 [Bacteroides sp.]|nr:hypothetical protein [Bacteroides sp.]
MKINRNNYEAFLLDLAEGRLTAEDRRELRDFLLLHPDCAGEMPDLQSWVLEKEEISFPGREALKKHLPPEGSELTDTNFDLISIARLENDLSPEQLHDHESLVATDELKREEWDAWKKTRLVPPRIVFPGKKNLKKGKGPARRVIWTGILSAAAAITLLLVLTRLRPALEEPQPLRQTELRENDPAGEEADGTQAAETIPQRDPGNMQLASEPVILSIKKKPDPPELTGVDAGKKNPDGQIGGGPHPSAGSGDTLSLAGRERTLRERVRIAMVERSSPDLVPEAAYDRITPLKLPPGSAHLSNISLDRISSLDLQQLFDDFTEENEISIWTIANSGIRGFNRITGADISLMAQKDEEGDLSGIAFRSRHFSFSRRIPVED